MTIALRQRPLARVVQGIVRAGAGCWLDPSDLSTLYQDAAGTTPVTAVEQPVGLMLDKSRGMMLGPELVDGALWGGLATGVTYSNGNFTLTAATSTLLAANSFIIKGKYYQVSFTIQSISTGSLSLTFEGGAATTPTYTTAGTYTVRICATASGNLFLYNRSASTTATVSNVSCKEIYGNHATQSITASRPTLSARKNVLLATETLATQSVTSIAAQYTLSFIGTGIVTLSGTATGTLTGTGVNDRVSLTVTPTAGTLTLTVSGSVTKAQLEPGASAGPYQRVNTATDYDTDERYFPKYLSFDGVDDYLNLPYMGLYAGGSASIITGRDALSQATDTYIISERSTTDVNPKYYPSRQLSSGGNMDSYITDNAGTVVLDTTGSAFGGASNAVIRSVIDAGNSIKLLKNGAVAASDNYTRGGTLTLNKTTIGASVSTTTSNYAKMKLYGLLITKSALSDAQRIACERYAASKAGVIL